MSEWADELVELLFRSSFMTLATSDEASQPWASPVEFACDEELRFYWASEMDARHSRNISNNPRVALSIYDSAQMPGDASVQAIYAEGPVEVFHRNDLGPALASVTRWIEWRDRDRVTLRPQTGAERSRPDTPWRYYRVKPGRMYALEPESRHSLGRLVDRRVPVDLRAAFARAYRLRLPSSD